MDSHSHETVFIVDDDDALRCALEAQLASASYPVETYPSAERFLESGAADQAGCLILDLHMPGMSGLELLQRLGSGQTKIAVLVLSGHGDIPSAVQAIRAGAHDFLEKPITDEELLEKVGELVQVAKQKHQRVASAHQIFERMDRLTPRERQVMELIVAGQRSRAIAEQFGVSRRTIEAHRARVMEKMQARNIAELLRMTHSVSSET